jgi:hypothetical protein
VKKAKERPGGGAAKPAPVTVPIAAEPAPADRSTLLSDLRTIVQSARQRLATAANATCTVLCWQVGRRLLREDLQAGCAAYGQQILATVSRELTAEFGAGFNYPALTRMARRQKVGGMRFQRTDGELFDPAVANQPRLSTALREMQPQAEQRFHEVDELRPAATHKECLSVRRKGAREGLPYTTDAWVDSDATRINCEVSFTRHVWHFKPKLGALLGGAPA